MQTRIKFIAQGANSLIGGFVAGDILLCGKEIADHLVGVGVAKYLDEPPPVVADESAPKRGRKPKQP